MNKKKEILEAYNYRYACKAFDTEKKITDEDFDFILETGRLSPSSLGWEPWQFVVLQNMTLREKIMPLAWGAQRQLPTASHFVLLLSRKGSHLKPSSDYPNYMTKQIQKLPTDIANTKLEFVETFQKNDFGLTDHEKLGDWAMRQTYLPFANMMTSAAQIGIDSCPIEGFNRAAVEKILIEEKIMNPEEFGLTAMVAFGYRAKDSELFPKTRRPVDEVIKWVI